MQQAYAIVKDDFEQIQAIQQKWKHQEIKKEFREDFKRLKLNFNEEQNQDFQLPDVFITTKQYHSKPAKSPKTRKKQSFSFDYVFQSIKMSKNQRNLELSTLESNYKKFKKYCCSIKQSPKEEILSQCVSISRDQNFQKIDGIKFPESLYTIHKKRRDKLDDIFKNQTCDNSIYKIKQFEEENQKQCMISNKQKEYTSRSYLDNAYFSILSVNRECRQRVKNAIQYSLPQESRFQQF
ncbi:unnamed protein product (macronuclear) [Paramecium tetraurelia]|uniref:Uncharacterized protein n=1 Tax=Paramecium tetraurelia TaxID=5888 RepID=A0DDC4_PARTE|nr:uncharacterized protein GSPATT00015900001 [Paramecium tetraurelia]CAK81041.1 unnamed protein product [Paramecium tetraurelia]|eukprot:XP_001448438.1 hypothetical protein (macronuclear) [Paramecium tetraurelia strain d4-2]